MSYTCPECNKVFHRACNYNAHLKTHPTGEEFQCQKCSKTFEFEYNYKKHVDTAHILPTNSTTLEELVALAYKKTKKKSNNATRKRILKYNCKYCNKKLCSPSILRIHENSHVGLKAFKCKLCHQKFSNKCSLKTHLFLHQGIKPFKCPKCNLSFAQKCNLICHFRRRHPINVDTNKMVRCEFCSCFYKDIEGNLNRHIRKEHPEKFVPKTKTNLKKVVSAKNHIDTGGCIQEAVDDDDDDDDDEEIATALFLYYLSSLN